ncbi:TPA: co-chaperone GroES [Escherichia coli]|nr:co-chaperone GroES [Escherichia coli]
MFHTIVSIKNDGHYFCRAGGNRPDGLNEPVTVVAVGEGKVFDNGNVRAPKVKVGDQVLFGKYAGTEVKLDGTEYLVVKEDDIFAVLG